MTETSPLTQSSDIVTCKIGYMVSQRFTTTSVSRLTISDEQSSTTAVTPTPTATSTPTLTSNSAPSRPPSSLDISWAVNRQYADLQIRLDSYRGWRWSHVQDPRTLSVAGFYYAGYRDCVRCFYCGVGLRTWEKEDDPWVEHVRWRSSCDYVRCMKGEQFVIRALVGNHSSSAVVVSLQPSVGNNMHTRRSLRTTDEDKTESQSMSLTSTSAPQGRQYTTSETEIPPPTSSQSQSTLDTSPARSLTGMSSAREVKESSTIQIVEQTKPDFTNTMPADDEGNSRISKNTKKQNVEGPEQKTLQRQLEEENQSLRDESTCKVCLDNSSCIVFLPCGHLVTCAECAPALRKCPVCRALIRGTVRAYSD